LKKLSHQLQPYREVSRLIQEIICDDKSIKRELFGRVITHLILHAEHQFGDRVLGKDYRERENGERINNYEVEIEQLIRMYITLTDYYSQDKSLGYLRSGNLRFPLNEKVLDLLRPWCADLDSNSTGRINSITKDQINKILFLSAAVENNTALIYMHRSQFNLAKAHCERGLSSARRFEGTDEVKTDRLCAALETFCNLRRNERNYAEALTYAEENYNCLAVAYNPVHPKVQGAASTLIECLIRKGDFNKAELFAQMTLDSLKDSKNGLDQQSEAVAKGYFDLANVIHEQEGDHVKAEMLGRESLRIRVLTSSNNSSLALAADLLASILMFQNKMGSETKELYELALAINQRNYGPDGANTAAAHINLGIFHRQLAKVQQTVERRKENLRLSEIKIKEGLRINRKIYGPDDPRTLEFSSQLSITTRMLSEK
jgi:hypothetical protein